MSRLPKTPTNPKHLRAIVDLRRAGWLPKEIMEILGVSRATFTRRLAEIREIRATAEASR